MEGRENESTLAAKRRKTAVKVSDQKSITFTKIRVGHAHWPHCIGCQIGFLSLLLYGILNEMAKESAFGKTFRELFSSVPLESSQSVDYVRFYLVFRE